MNTGITEKYGLKIDDEFILHGKFFIIKNIVWDGNQHVFEIEEFCQKCDYK
jgi:hypothetical protein